MWTTKRGFDQLFYPRSLTLKALTGKDRLDVPMRGFTHMWEKEFETADGWHVTWAWVVGGRNNGCRYTIAIAQKGHEHYEGWVYGHKDYVFMRLMPSKAIRAIALLRPEALRLTFTLPGFYNHNDNSENEYRIYHKDGWYSTGLFAIEIDPVSCIKTQTKHADDEVVMQPDVFLIKEGVYIAFPDESYRLMSREEYRDIGELRTPNFRQGDLMIWISHDVVGFGDDCQSQLDYDRHKITCLNENGKIKFKFDQNHRLRMIYINSPFIVEHPQHGTLKIEGARQYAIKLLPGTSRPFQSGRID